MPSSLVLKSRFPETEGLAGRDWLDYRVPSASALPLFMVALEHILAGLQL